MAGAPGEQSLYSTLRDPAEAARVWEISQELAGVQLSVVR
jgi:hypothetical protein